MEIETLRALNEGLSQNLLLLLEVTVRIVVISVSIGFVIYLVGIAWLCVEEMRQRAPRRLKPAPEPSEPDECDLLAVMAALDDNLSDNFTGGLSRCPLGVTTDLS